MSKYVKHNQNPFENTTVDCAIRSLSQALDIDYEKTCMMMGKRFKEGKGLDEDGVLLNDLVDFYKKYKLIKPIKFDNPFFDYVYRGKDYEPTQKWETLSEFADNHKGKYIVLVRRSDVDMSKDAARDVFKMTFHVVFVDGNKHEYYDNMRNDPGDMTVYGYFKVV